MLEMLSYGFMQKAFVTGIVIAVACSLLGVFLVLRRYALIGDGLAHISFGGVACGMLFGIAPLYSALVFSLLGALGILKLRDRTRLHGDTSIGIISHASLGLGIFLASIAQGYNADLLSYLFGSILAIKAEEVIMSVILAAAVIISIGLFYNELFFLTFDEETAKTSGVGTTFLSALLVTLTALTVVSSMKVVGLMLASSLIILPPSTALLLRMSFRRTLVSAAAISVFSVVAGLVLAYRFDWAVSGTIVLINAAVFIVFLLTDQLRH